MKDLWICIITLLLSQWGQAAEPVPYPRLEYRILESRPHNTRLFTQGFIKTANGFYESGGRYGRSRLLHYHTDSRKPFQKKRLAANLFAEGLTLFENKLYLLTWKAGKTLVFDPESLAPLATLRYQGQGWGLTHNRQHLIMSDGSHRLTFRRPDNFEPVKTLAVHLNGKPWSRLNELEFIEGEIWANTWLDNRIVTINPDSGEITGVLDLARLAYRHHRGHSGRVLNGIAYDEEKRAVWITGKLWPRMYLLAVTRPEKNP